MRIAYCAFAQRAVGIAQVFDHARGIRAQHRVITAGRLEGEAAHQAHAAGDCDESAVCVLRQVRWAGGSGKAAQALDQVVAIAWRQPPVEPGQRAPVRTLQIAQRFACLGLSFCWIVGRIHPHIDLAFASSPHPHDGEQHGEKYNEGDDLHAALLRDRRC